jgi:4-diphosphocytidyl-2-C-methyl-D-erythritol kinase
VGATCFRSSNTKVRVTVPSFAKLNLDLRVLSKRSDGYHDLRTIFQTISLKDSVRIDFDFAKRTQIELDSSVEIADNLVVRAAKLVLEHLKMKAHVRFVLSKQIPMGAGLGGGSSNAAAVLIALPALADKPLPFAQLSALAAKLGSDVPFFLHGGTALGLGRGTELYPLPDLAQHHALVVSTGIHVSTAEAYQALGRVVTNALTSEEESPILREFQAVAWSLDSSALAQLPFKNNFEPVVFQNHPELAAVVRKLRKLGAKPAMMTGSGSAVFGVFAKRVEVRQAAEAFGEGRTYPVTFVNRRQYQTLWRRALGTAAKASCFTR